MIYSVEPERIPGKGVFVYFAVAPVAGRVKIGVTDNLKNRMSAIRTNCPESGVYIFGFIKLDGTRAMKAEEYFHNRLSQYHSHGEWYIFDPWVESYLEDVILNSDIPNM